MSQALLFNLVCPCPFRINGVFFNSSLSSPMLSSYAVRRSPHWRLKSLTSLGTCSLFRCCANDSISKLPSRIQQDPLLNPCWVFWASTYLSSVWPFGFHVLRLVSRPLNSTGEHPNSEVRGTSVAQPHKSHSIISVVLCWLKQSQKSARLKGEGSGPHFSMGRVLKSFCQRGIRDTVSIFGELHPPWISACWLVF